MDCNAVWSAKQNSRLLYEVMAFSSNRTLNFLTHPLDPLTLAALNSCPRKFGWTKVFVVLFSLSLANKLLYVVNAVFFNRKNDGSINWPRVLLPPTYRGSASGGCAYRWVCIGRMGLPTGGSASGGGGQPPSQLGKRAVLILLECFLVCSCFGSAYWRRKTFPLRTPLE